MSCWVGGVVGVFEMYNNCLVSYLENIRKINIMKRSLEFKQEKGFISHTQGHTRHGVIGHTHLCV